MEFHDDTNIFNEALVVGQLECLRQMRLEPVRLAECQISRTMQGEFIANWHVERESRLFFGGCNFQFSTVSLSNLV